MLFDPGFKSQSPMGNPTQDFASALNAMRSSLQGAPLNSPSGTVQNGLENMGQQTAQQQPSATPPAFERPFPYDNLGSSGSGLGQLARAMGGGMGGMGGAGGGQSMSLGNLSVNFNPSSGGMSFAKGGEVPSSGGLKLMAQELQDMGRGGDTMLAHINPQEAALLKRMGGSGTINPATGLPEFFKGFKSVAKVFKPIEKAIIRPIGDALKPIMPYAQYIAPFIPGVNAAWAAGIGALGSGFAGGGGFNFKRGLMGGMTAYGLSNLYTGLQGAGGGAPTTSTGPMELGVPGTELAPTTVAQTGLTVPPGAAGADIGSQIMAGDFSNAASTIGQNISEGASNLGNNFSRMGSDFTNQMSDAGQGIKNLSGLGEGTMADAAKGFKGTGATLTNTLGAGYMGYTGSMALDEYEKQKKEAELAGATDEAQRAALQQEIAVIDARIQENKRRAEQAVRNNPYQFAEGGEVPRYFSGGNIRNIFASIAKSIKPQIAAAEVPMPQQAASAGITSGVINKASPEQLAAYVAELKKGSGSDKSAYLALLNNQMNFADGGQVDDEAGTDDYYGGGIAAMAKGGMPPRFLSGGGDGMSDSIKAKINGTQEARLADGEFVIPADVVSHLGNGSSKAGAKQLYSMMDKVRSARTGTKKQGKQINPARFMPA
jgi:hypothetical protein